MTDEYDFIHVSFDKNENVPDFKPGEIYSIEIETIPERVIRRNEEEHLSPSMRID
ncbi:hypothetical protein NG798_27695 [Ancylothrix sp. C2]|uniref:hypothetical protein n=1 Tax=Ancylothrix sp. D3o TaxID=2953691 RepID=UPI0021BABC88|nr:hypothetical protein [Ancylothrix sp. D3o]MCT7953585.1 hypothetical protein [Ancylothrix sp. D3o]